MDKLIYGDFIFPILGKIDFSFCLLFLCYHSLNFFQIFI